MRRPLLQRLILAIALCSLIGGHRGVIQCVAWGKMIYERAAERPLTEALASTFSGDEPCDICLALRNGDDEKKAPSAPVPNQKIDLAPVASEAFVPACCPLLAEYPEPGAPMLSASMPPPISPPPERA